MITTIIFAVIAVCALYVMLAYNKFVSLKNKTAEAWSDIDTHLKRRYDLIPNLVETVKGYASHEAETFEKVTKARSAAMAEHNSVAKTAEDENALSGVLKNLFALQEAYPELKANQNFLKLHEDLTETEDKIQKARRFYNANVLIFNTKREQFPGNIIAKMFNFAKQPFFELSENEKEAAVKPADVKL
ncbi:MAG: LemA family protein [Endomicrobium sp.]|jgi:LemA protein|nr:LemA family protein [Endomicrobium sp.]